MPSPPPLPLLPLSPCRAVPPTQHTRTPTHPPTTSCTHMSCRPAFFLASVSIWLLVLDNCCHQHCFRVEMRPSSCVSTGRQAAKGQCRARHHVRAHDKVCVSWCVSWSCLLRTAAQEDAGWHCSSTHGTTHAAPEASNAQTTHGGELPKPGALVATHYVLLLQLLM